MGRLNKGSIEREFAHEWSPFLSAPATSGTKHEAPRLWGLIDIEGSCVRPARFEDERMGSETVIDRMPCLGFKMHGLFTYC